MGVTINGVAYEVGMAAISRHLRQEEKYRVTTEDGIVHREVRAIYADFELSLGNLNQTAYDNLMAMLQTATGDITVALPKTAATSAVYTGVFDGINDEVITADAGGAFWDNLTLSFTGTVPLGG